MRNIWGRTSLAIIVLLLLWTLPVAASGDDVMQQDESDSAAVRVIPNEGDIGDSHVILVTGLEDNETVTVRIIFDDTENVVYSTEQTANSRGTVEVDIFTETGDNPGDYTVEVLNASDDVIGSASLTILEPEPLEVELTIEPAEAEAGETFTLTLVDVEPFVILEVSIDDEDGEEVFSTRLRATVDGDAVIEYDSALTTNGELTVTVTQVIQDDATEIASGTLTVIGQDFPATVVPDVSEASIGDTVFVTVSGLTPEADATLALVLDELTVALITETSNINGIAIFELPLLAEYPAGDYELDVLQEDGIVGIATLNVLPAEDAETVQADDTDDTTDEVATNTGIVAQVDPADADAGDTIFITVSGLEADASVTIDVLLGEETIDTLEETANVSGLLVLAYELPADAVAGDYTVAVSAGDELLSVADFSVVLGEVVADINISIDPAIARQGERVEIIVADLIPDTQYTVEISQGDEVIFTSDETADANGAIGVAVSSSSDNTTGIYNVAVLDGENVVTTATFQLVAEDAEIDTASLSISPETGTQGTEYVLEITGLNAEEDVDVRVTQGDDVVFETTRTANDDGQIVIVLNSSTDDAPDTYSVEIVRDDSSLTGSFAITEGEAQPAQIAIDPPAGELLTEHEVTVTGLNPDETFTFAIEFDGEEVYSVERTADENGTFVTTLATAEGDPEGEYIVIVDREDTDDVTAILTIGDDVADVIELTVEPVQIEQEDDLTITLSGLAEDQTATIEILFDGEIVFTTDDDANADGEIILQLTSESTDPEGEYTVNAIVDGEVYTQTLVIGSASVATAQADATIDVAPDAGPRGTEYIFEVSDLDPSEEVAIEVRFEGETVFETTRTANQDGSFTITLVSSDDDELGDYEFVVIRDGDAETVAIFTVSGDDDDTASASDGVTVVVEPETTELGEEFVVIISGLEAEETVTVDVQLDGDSIFITDETADENGVAELALVSDDTDTLGEYDVIVTRDNDEIATGVFTLASDITNAITDDNDDDDEQDDDEQQDDDTVDVGSIELNAELEYELTGELTDDEPFAEYLFVGTEGQEVTITLDSEDFDTYLFLVDEDGNELISNDDSRGTLNSQIVDFELPYTGEYSILVSSFSFVVAEQAETGDFDLIIEATEASNDDDDTVDTGDVDIVAGGDAIVDELDVDNQTREYVFAGEAGSAVTITLDSDQFDTYLVLLDENGSEITFNDDSRGSLNSQIASFELPYTGEYTIVVTSYGNRVFGDTVVGEFTLTLESVVFLRGEYDETIELVFDGSASTQSITFDADAGDVISITADSGGDFDTVATLTDEFGRVIASDDDGGSGFDPEIERVVIELTGSYTLAISTFNTGDEGEVDVTINLDDVRTLDNDEVRTVRLNNKMNADVLTLEGEAGDIISLEIDLVNGSIADLAIIASQNGFQLMNYTTFGLPSTITLGFEVPADGTVIISFRDNGQVNAELEVSIERE